MPTLEQLRERYAAAAESELRQVLASPDYTEDARLVAHDELERRGMSGPAFRTAAVPAVASAAPPASAARSPILSTRRGKLWIAIYVLGAMSAVLRGAGGSPFHAVAGIALAAAIIAAVVYFLGRHPGVRTFARATALVAWCAECVHAGAFADPARAIGPTALLVGVLAGLSLAKPRELPAPGDAGR